MILQFELIKNSSKYLVTISESLLFFICPSAIPIEI